LDGNGSYLLHPSGKQTNQAYPGAQMKKLEVHAFWMILIYIIVSLGIILGILWGTGLVSQISPQEMSFPAACLYTVWSFILGHMSGKFTTKIVTLFLKEKDA
jgi:Mg2+/citrate symporter